MPRGTHTQCLVKLSLTTALLSQVNTQITEHTTRPQDWRAGDSVLSVTVLNTMRKTCWSSRETVHLYANETITEVRLILVTA